MPNERFTVPSPDGVAISVQKAGSGPALLLVHGALLNGTLSWGAVLPRLAEHFTVYVMDRRGRAPSGDSKQYSIANEADDIVAVVESIGGAVTVLSHSYGALASIEALNRLKSVPHLILYEAPVTLHPFESDVVARMEQALQANDRETVVTTFLRDQVRVPVDRLDAMKASPIWPIVLDISVTLPRESRAVNTYTFSKQPLINCEIPVTVLLGSATAGMMRDAAFFLRDTIPGCRLVVLEGQGHGAMLDAPDFFAAKVIDLITAPNRSSSHTAD
jgi:pimeloyl-ACP methyl ester carboxylesterase